jgi:hypothetical protein
MAAELVAHFLRSSQVTPQHIRKRCVRRIRRRDDHLRMSVKGSCSLLHWHCFVALMRENAHEIRSLSGE